MTLTLATKGKARKLAKRISNLHNGGMSYRAMSPLFGGVPAGTLNRIALSGGEWIPKGIDELMKLGVITERKPRRLLPKWFVDTQESKDYWMSQREHQREMQNDTNTARRGELLDKEWKNVTGS